MLTTKNLAEMSANKAYNLYKANTENPKSFKDWLIDQKEKNNVDGTGKVIIDKPETVLQPFANAGGPADAPKPGVYVWGMPIYIAVPVAAVAAYGVYRLVKFLMKPKVPATV